MIHTRHNNRTYQGGLTNKFQVKIGRLYCDLNKHFASKCNFRFNSIVDYDSFGFDVSDTRLGFADKLGTRIPHYRKGEE